MSKRIILEGKKWVKDGIISEAQFEQIVSRYEQEKNSNMLPLFASLLVGLGVLSFIASNWDGISQLVRVAILLFFMCVFYLAGERILRGGESDRIGFGLIGMGVFTFGAGIFLIGQMFHFQSYSDFPFIVWSISALLAVQFWKSKFLLLVATIIVTAGQLYSTTEFSSFSYFLALLLLFGVGHFIFHRPNIATSIVFSLSYLLTGLLFVISNEINHLYLFAIYLGLYVLSDFISKVNVKHTIQLTMVIGAVIVTIFNIFWSDSFFQLGAKALSNSHAIYPFLIVSILAFFFFRKRGTFELVDGILFLPVFYLELMGNFIYLLILFIYSISLLIIGYREQIQNKVTFGTVLFLLSAFVGYIHLAWDFMPKSMFFLIGGITLFLLSWFLDKQRRKLVKGVERND